jgi:hypothetical protein
VRTWFFGIALLVTACGSSQEIPISTAPSTPVVSASVPFKAVAASGISGLLAWTPNDGAVWYRLKRNGVQVALLEQTQTLYRDSRLEPDSRYEYTLTAETDSAILETRQTQLTTANTSPDRSPRDLPPPDANLSRAYSDFNWTPHRLDNAPLWLHHGYWVYGADNKVYPTWHPSAYTDSAGKLWTFGHEHGANPADSSLYSTTGDVAFGFVNEQLEPNNPSLQRNEDHVGHKVMVESATVAATRNTGKPDQTQVELECDLMTKLHMGTHSPDALKNNLHELYWNMRCTGGLEMRLKVLSAIGQAGGFRSECPNQPSQDFAVGTPSPSNSPYFGGGLRIIPTSACVNAFGSTGESWQNGVSIGYKLNQPAFNGGMGLALGPYFKVSEPARYFDEQTKSSARTLDLCYDPASGLYQKEVCKKTRASSRPAWDDPASPFKGAVRTLDFTGIGLRNNMPHSRWYTDVYGKNAEPSSADPSRNLTIRQFAAANVSFDLAPLVFPARDFGAHGVHAPN